jgi:hypothetical protein
MSITKTKEQLKKLIDETGNEDVLNEVRSILELASDGSNELTDEQKKELDLLEEQYCTGKLKSYSWEDIKEVLKGRIAKEEMGRSIYHDAREVFEHVKQDLRNK